MRRSGASSNRVGVRCEWRAQNYLRREFLLLLRPELSLLNRFAFAATRVRYRRTILSIEAPAIKLLVASRAESSFSRTITSASRRALLPPCISFIIRRATTPFASAASIITEVNICLSARRDLRWGILYICQLTFCLL